jgi:hypothetical protein
MEVDPDVPARENFGLLVVAMAGLIAKRLETDTLEFVRYELSRPLEALLPRSAPLALRGQVGENPLGIAGRDCVKAALEICSHGLRARVLGRRRRNKQTSAEDQREDPRAGIIHIFLVHQECGLLHVNFFLLQGFFKLSPG